MGTIFEKRLWIPSGNEYEVVLIDSIFYCASYNQYTMFYVYEGTNSLKPVLSTRGIGIWEQELDVHGFYRIHAKTLVNLIHIKKFINTKDSVVILTDDTKLNVSQAKKQKFMEFTGIR